MYIYRRNSIYHYRVRIPQVLQTYFNRTEVHKSLKTSNRAIALKYAKMLQAHFEYIKKGVSLQKFNDDELNEAIENFINLQFRVYEKYLYHDPKQGNLYYYSMLKSEIEDIKRQLNCEAEFSTTIKLESKNIFNYIKSSREFHNEDTRYRLTAKLLLHVYETIIQKIKKGEYFPPDDASLDSIVSLLNKKQTVTLKEPLEAAILPTIIREKADKKTLTLEQAYDNFIRHTKVANNWTKDTIGEHNRVKKYMIMYFGSDKDINTITRENLLNLRSLLIDVPLRWSQSKIYKDITSLIELTTKAKSLKAKTQSSVTVDKILTHLFGFFEYLEINGTIDKNPHVKLRINTKKSSKAKTKAREAYSTEELNKLINSPLYQENIPKTLKTNPEYIYIPLLAMFQGTRLNELCQLYKEDVKQIDGIWCIDINRNRDKSIKNDESIRVIPIHKSIIDAGFIEYVKSVTTPRLWNNLQKTEKYDDTNEDEGSYSKSFSSWYRRAINRKYITQDKKRVFHSFRHNVVSQLLDNDIRVEHIASIVGHAQEFNITIKHYGKAISPKILQSSLNSITYSEITNLQSVISDIKKTLKI